MSPRSNVKLDSLAVLAATVTYSILEGKLDEIAFFSQQRQGLGGMIGWQPMMAHSAANKRVALTLLVSVNVMDENFYRTSISTMYINVEASLETITTLLSSEILQLHTSLQP